MTTKTWLTAFIIANVITAFLFIVLVAVVAGPPTAVGTLVGIALISYVMTSYISGQWFYKK